MKLERYIEIRKTIRSIIRDTVWDNHVFVVGGCVRDELMENEIKDVDMCVDLQGGGVRFADWLYSNNLTTCKPVIFPAYGTSMFHLRQFPDVELECVQTRKEKYQDSKTRNPETAFGSIEEDCLLRDLTINALYCNVSTDELLDLTGKGIEDIHDHVIRTTADPDIIFEDDPLRILRCIRFATRYGWDIEEKTFKGMKKNAERLAIVNHERIRDELDKMLTCRFPVRAMELMKVTSAMHYVVPEMEQTFGMTQNHYHFGTVWEHTLKVLDNMKDSRLEMRLAALLHDIGKINTREETSDGKVHFIGHEKSSALLVESIMRYLRYPMETIRKVQFLTLHHMDTKNWKDDLSMMKTKHLRQLQYECRTEKRFRDLMLLVDADNKAHAKGYCLEHQAEKIIHRTEIMRKEGSALFEYSLPFSGKDVMDLKSLNPGPAVKECMEYLLKLAFVNPLRSREEWTKHLIGYHIKK